MADNIIRKVEKLLRLAESSNIHEAALAAAKAKAIADKYGIALEILRERTGEENRGILNYQRSYGSPFRKNLCQWELGLAQVLAKHHRCRAFVDVRNNLNIVGFSEDIFLLDSMFSWLQAQLKMLILEEKIAKEWHDIFAFGAIQFIDEELTKSETETKEQMKEKFKEASSAIEKLDNRLSKIDHFLRNETFVKNEAKLNRETELFNKGWVSAEKILLNKKILN